MSYEIQKGIPIPPHNPRGHKTKYPWSGMEVGDSFEAPNREGDKSADTAKRIASAAYCWARQNKNGRIFIARATENGARIWRTV